MNNRDETSIAAAMDRAANALDLRGERDACEALKAARARLGYECSAIDMLREVIEERDGAREEAEVFLNSLEPTS